MSLRRSPWLFFGLTPLMAATVLDGDPSPYELQARPLLAGPAGCAEVRGNAQIDIVFVKPGGWRGPGETTTSRVEGSFSGRLVDGLWVSRSSTLTTTSGPPMDIDDIMPVMGKNPKIEGKEAGGSVSISVGGATEPVAVSAAGAEGVNVVDGLIEAMNPDISLSWLEQEADGTVVLVQDSPLTRGQGSVVMRTRFPAGGSPTSLDVRLPRKLKVGEDLFTATLMDAQVHLRATATSLGILPVEEGISLVVGALGFTVGLDQRLVYTAYRPC